MTMTVLLVSPIEEVRRPSLANHKILGSFPEDDAYEKLRRSAATPTPF
jgi:hypothetical protein